MIKFRTVGKRVVFVRLKKDNSEYDWQFMQ